MLKADLHLQVIVQEESLLDQLGFGGLCGRWVATAGAQAHRARSKHSVMQLFTLMVTTISIGPGPGQDDTFATQNFQHP